MRSPDIPVEGGNFVLSVDIFDWMFVKFKNKFDENVGRSLTGIFDFVSSVVAVNGANFINTKTRR